MSDTIDYANLTLQDALDLAILVEDEAKERYEEFVHLMTVHHTEEAAGFFKCMAINETKHGDELRKRRAALFGDAPSRVDGTMLYEVEAPAPSEVRAFMSVQQALTVALEAETKAYEFFDKALPSIENDDVKELFAELREEEIEHQELVKKAMKKAGDDPGTDPDDYVDPPVAQ